MSSSSTVSIKSKEDITDNMESFEYDHEFDYGLHDIGENGNGKDQAKSVLDVGGYGGDDNNRQYSGGSVNRWMMPPAAGEVPEEKVQKHFDPDTINTSVVPSPLRPIKGYMRLGLLVGAFPADVGERYIHYYFNFCEARTWYVMLVLLLWLAGGAGLLVYCLIHSTDLTIESIVKPKSSEKHYYLSTTDQTVLFSIPVISLIFIPILIGISWSRINLLSDLCETFVTNGYRVGNIPTKRTMGVLVNRLILFAVGQLLMNIHIALVFCDTSTKQAVLSILLVLWQIPLYIATTFAGYILLHFVHTLTEYFVHLRSDILYKNESIARDEDDPTLYNKVLKFGGLPKRLDRLIDQVRNLQAIYGSLLFYEFALNIYLLVASMYIAIIVLINSFKNKTQETNPPWWCIGYILLGLHHYMRMAMFCHAGEHLRRELFKTLSIVSQFGFVQNDTALLALAIARRPDQLLTIAGYARMDRTALSKIFYLALLAVIATTNLKLMDNYL